MQRATPQTRLASALRRLVEREIPTAQPEGARVIGVGFDVVAWRVPDPTGDWTLRVARHPGAVAVVEAQTALMQMLSRAKIPVPREPDLLGEDASHGGIYRFVEGRPAAPRDEAETDALAAALGSILSQLHAQGLPAHPRSRRVHPIEDRFGPVIERCLPHLDERHRAWAIDVMRRLEALAESIPALVLVHADLKPEHVLLDEEHEVEALLDFEGIQASDPAIDFSRLIQHWGRPFAQRTLTSYALPAGPHFMERAQIYADLDALELLDTALQDDVPGWKRMAVELLDGLVAR